MFQSLVYSSAHSPVPLAHSHSPLAHSHATLAHSHAGHSEGTRAGTIIIVFCNFLDPAKTKQASKEGRKQASNQARKQGSTDARKQRKEGRQEASRQASKQASERASKQASKEGRKEASKQANRQARKRANKRTSKQATKEMRLCQGQGGDLQTVSSFSGGHNCSLPFWFRLLLLPRYIWACLRMREPTTWMVSFQFNMPIFPQ